jgi:hypothetical protein
MSKSWRPKRQQHHREERGGGEKGERTRLEVLLDVSLLVGLDLAREDVFDRQVETVALLEGVSDELEGEERSFRSTIERGKSSEKKRKESRRGRQQPSVKS